MRIDHDEAEQVRVECEACQRSVLLVVVAEGEYTAVARCRNCNSAVLTLVFPESTTLAARARFHLYVEILPERAS